MILVVGLTGGIATGKSTVVRMLQELGVRVLDADALVWQLEQPGTPIYCRIVALFGPGVIDADGQLRRRELAKRVFSDPQARQQLEAVVHPAVYDGLREQVQHLRQAAAAHRPERAEVVVIDIPLLYESDARQQLPLDRVAVVYAPEPVQVQRLMARDGLTLPEAQARLRAQWPLTQKVRQADDVVDNGNGLDATRRQVEALVVKWQRLANSGIA